ncbi:MAG TPA: lipoate--protein ligase family protein [Gemmataceae bacterium]|nr:lipoate--protein ligase family protein [Gemmataceae bacterium]
MEILTCRLLPYVEATGAWNMAADETLLEAAVAGVASFRLYGWTEATASLGYFQPADLLRRNGALARLPWVRRPTGGQALVHHHELTYALALPSGPRWQTSGQAGTWQKRMHGLIAAALADLGIQLTVLPSEAEQPFDGLLCFQHPTVGDLMAGTHKLVGSAQRRRRGALLQHGGILLAGSPYTPELPGLQELTQRTIRTSDLSEAITGRFRLETGWRLTPVGWGNDERESVNSLVAQKYSRPEWNAKR